MAKYSENTVPGVNQLAADARIRGNGDSHPRVLFLGNSATLHGPSAEIGWTGDWGMAASRAENDYVHVFMREFRKKFPEASWRIGQLADWERNYWLDEEVLNRFAALREWRADYIFAVFLGANSPEALLSSHDFSLHYEKMLRYFDPDCRARPFVTNMFWENASRDDAVRRAAANAGAILVDINDLGRADEMTALGKYAHSGVAMHPGDLGMYTIAARLLAAAADQIVTAR